MYDVLVNHALQNVWCTPDQDKQAIIQPAKITGLGGVWNAVDVLWRKILLPMQRTRFHVYQIGQLYPILVSLAESNGQWMKISDACNKGNVIIDIYAASGLQLPRTETWYMITPDRNVILAVKEQPKIAIDLDNDHIFLRFYNNAYFASSASDPLNDYVLVEGVTANIINDILAIQQRFITLSALPGAVYAFVNGFKVSGVDLITVKIGDIVEIVYDSSIRTIIDIPIDSLREFVSTLDQKHKYLLHYAGVTSKIDYHDDIDFFLIVPDANGRHTGVYYHRNQEDAVRMVTHKDYSITVPYVAGYVQTNPAWTDAAAFVVRMHVRKSGYQRGLVFEHNRIEELYKLPEDRLVNAMMGVNSTVSNWTAAELEASAYAQLMRSVNVAVDRIMVQNAYGYNAISKLIADTPAKTTAVGNMLVTNVPYALTNNSVAYEYDNNGLLVGWSQHNIGVSYVAKNPNVAFVEMIAGLASMNIGDLRNVSNIKLDAKAEYRFYSRPMANGAPIGPWKDVTGTTDYDLVNGVVSWNINPMLNEMLIRSNKNVLCYDVSVPASFGVVAFTLLETVTELINGVPTEVTRPMEIPMGELDLFMNGYSLVEGVDYIVNFPEIVITNKTHLLNVLTAPQKFTVRFTGFCNKDMTRTPQEDKGFIKFGLLSYNNRFDIRDDKVLRIIVGGKLYTRDMLKFSETDSGVTVPNSINGSPYQIRDIVVPMRGITVDDTYTLRNASKAVDKRISDYMTSWLPEPHISAPNVIGAPYAVYSPFCSRIIGELAAGLINDPRLVQHYSDADVIDICKPYEYLLKSDLTQTALRVDSNYVEIHPHSSDNVVNLNLYQYKFLTRVVKLYTNGLVDISHFVNISQ